MFALLLYCRIKYHRRTFPLVHIPKFSHPTTQEIAYNTRKFPKHRTEHYKKSFHYSALKEWNNTPRDVRELPTINTFKRN